MKTIFRGLLLSLFCLNAYAVPVTLDFSSGVYNDNKDLYLEDGFTTHASEGFDSIGLNTLAWYETDNIMSISSAGNLFDLNNLWIANTAYAGLIFESSKGGFTKVGSISGPLSFLGDEWQGIESFTIRTSLTNFDILNQIDNITLDTVSVPESSSMLLFLFALLLLPSVRNKYKS